MPPLKRVQKKRRPKKAPVGPVEKVTIDLTKTSLQNTEPENINILPSLSKPCSIEGLVKKKQKDKTGAEQILMDLKKHQTSGKIIEKQMELTNKLARFQDIHDELDVERGEAAASHLGKIPQLDWLTNSRKCLSEGTAASGDAVSMAREVYHKFSNNDQFLKTLKLANCMKYMNIEAHPHLMKEWYMEPLPALAESQGVTIVETPTQCFRTVALSRSLPRQLVADQKKMLQVSEPRKSSMRFLYILAASEAASQLQSRALTSHMAARKHMLRGQITVIVLDCANYFKKGKPKHDLEMAIIDLLVTLAIDTLIVNTPEELSTVILQFTKAVAEEPTKLAKRMVDEQAEFYMRGDNKNCVTVDQNGNGSSRLWQQMLSVLPQSSLEVSRAVAAEFPGPRLLADALSREAGVSQLADVGVARSALPGARPRRLGPEMANKLKVLFTTRDGNVVVE